MSLLSMYQYKNLFLAGIFLCCILTPESYAADTTMFSGIKKDINRNLFPDLTIDPGTFQDSTSFILPFSRAGNLIIVKARVDSTDGNFILDTGCPGLVLNITYFRNYTRVTDYNAENFGISGSAGIVESVLINNFLFGGIQQYKIMAHLANLGNIENSKGIKILGLIGMQFLKNCEMIVDYEKNQIYFHVIGRKEYRTYLHPMLNDTALYTTVPFEITQDRIIVNAVMEGKKLKFLIDCAAETNVLDSRLPDRIFENIDITGRILLTGVGNKKVEALQGNLSNLKIGKQQINSMPVLIANLEKSCLSQVDCVDGVLGFDFLSLQKIGFNFVKRNMYLWK